MTERTGLCPISTLESIFGFVMRGGKREGGKVASDRLRKEKHQKKIISGVAARRSVDSKRCIEGTVGFY